ncbi:MAG: hypothetical protein ISS63_07560 [Desulfobacteraceae bacterium]|nr:hypothetical protein [Desulfobacteraceae bacterium]
MELHRVAKELGPVTVMDHLHRSRVNIKPITEKICRLLPMSFMGSTADFNFRANLAKMLKDLTELRFKRRLLLVGPELVFLEELSALRPDIQVLVAIDGSLPTDAVERICSNIPFDLNAKILPVPALPNPLGPADSVMMAVAFDGGRGLALVPDSTRSILNFYLPNYFFGEVFLLDPAGTPCFDRPEGWVTVTKSKFFTQHLKIESQH